jgi:hypothetical protein
MSEIYKAGSQECQMCPLEGKDPECYCTVQDIIFIEDDETENIVFNIKESI